MTLKRQSVQSRGNGPEQNKTVVPSCLEQRGTAGRGGGGGEVSETGERIEK